MSSQPVVYAGPGLLRSANTLSVNPNLRLLSLFVRDKVTVPEPQDSQDAASKRYVDSYITKLNVEGGPGIHVDNGNRVSLEPDVVLNSITLQQIVGNDGMSVPTKDYVDNAVKNLVTRSYVDNKMQNTVIKEELDNAVKPLASRTYVASLVERYVQSDELNKKIEPFATKTELTNAFNDKATISYVNSSLEKCVKTRDLENALSQVASRDFVYNAMAEIATKSELKQEVSLSANNLSQTISDTVNNAIQSLASKQYVQEVAKSTFSTSYVDNAIKPLVSKAHVDSVVAKLAEEAYVDEKISDLASKSYVRELVDKSTFDVSAYVDKAISTAKFPLVYPVQYSSPEDLDTVESNGKNLLMIDPIKPLSSLTIRFPVDVEDGKYLIITTSRNLDNVTWSNLVTAGDIPNNSISMKAGQSVKWVFSSEAKSWFRIQ